MKHLVHATPALKDKRLGLVLFAIAVLVALAARGTVPGETAATGIVTLVLAFLAQSQAGMTLRARADAAKPTVVTPGPMESA